jgi:hypothetical protein
VSKISREAQQLRAAERRQKLATPVRAWNWCQITNSPVGAKECSKLFRPYGACYLDEVYPGLCPGL